MVDDAMNKIAEDIPALKGYIQNIAMGQEDGIASLERNGSLLLLNYQDFVTEAAAKARLLEAVASGHTGHASDPRFMLAHELGHAAHTLAALKSLGYSSFPPLLTKGYQLFEKAYTEVMIGAIATTNLPGTAEEVTRAINKEMGTRASDPFTEIVAQSFGMHYYGEGNHPIADRVVAYIISLIHKE